MIKKCWKCLDDHETLINFINNNYSSYYLAMQIHHPFTQFLYALYNYFVSDKLFVYS